MRLLIIIFFNIAVLTYSASASAQGYCSCEEDVDAYSEGLKKMVLTGRLQQVKDSIEYLNRIEVVATDIKRYDMCDISSVECLRHLNRLGQILNLQSVLPRTRFLEAEDSLSRSRNSFTEQPLAYKSYDGDLMQFESHLATATAPEGIYYHGDIKVGITRDQTNNDYRTYVIDPGKSKVPKGTLVALSQQNYDSTLTTQTVLITYPQPNYLSRDMFMDGMILKSGFTSTRGTDLQQFLPTDSLPTIIKMADDLAYTSFAQQGVYSYKEGGMSSKEIEAGIRDPELTRLIIDMRTWYGHSYTTDANILDAIEDVKDEKDFYLIIGSSTGGANERLALYLRNEADALIFGHPSAGDLDLTAYDENRNVTLPSGRFYVNYEVPPIDNLSSYEFTGVPLDKILTPSEDYIEQIIAYFTKQDEQNSNRKLQRKLRRKKRKELEDRNERREERLEEIRERREQRKEAVKNN